MKRQYKSELSESIHEAAEGLYKIGLVDKITMRGFDKSCLIPTKKFSAKEIKDIRSRENLSQPVFAMYLNVSRNLVSDWERGVKTPGGPALRLLSIIKDNGVDILFKEQKPKEKIRSERRRETSVS